jgi:hypothetical protein
LAPPPVCFSELVENKGLIFLRVQEMQKTGEGETENKGVSKRWDVDFWRVLEVGVNEGLRGILSWAEELGDAGRRTGSVALTTNE